MIIAEITAGLGNQLFQYANARKISYERGHELKLDLTFFKTWKNPDVLRLDKFNTDYAITSQKEIDFYKRQNYSKLRYDVRLINKLSKRKLFKNNKYHVDHQSYDYDKYKIVKSSHLYLSGYWGDVKYFKGIENIIRYEFTLKDELNFENQKMQKKIENTNSVSLHVRRGDYVGNPYFADLPLSYYQESIKFIKNKFNDSLFYIFSDDLDWVKDNLRIGHESVFVDINNSSTDYMELILMASCKHNIIANSTFSWWGAWLNKNPNKIVVAPKFWFNNEKAQKNYELSCLVPKEWIKI